MKKRIALAMLGFILFAIPFTGFGRGGEGAHAAAGTPLFDFLKDRDTASFVRNFEKDFPVSVDVASFEVYDSGDYRKVTDAETIHAVFDALSNIRVFEKIGDSGSAYYMATIQYIFRIANDKQIVFGFHGGDLIYKGQQRYRIEGYEALLAALPPPDDGDCMFTTESGVGPELVRNVPGDPVWLYDGATLFPNVAGKAVDFRAPSQREGIRDDYYRAPMDGSSGAERLNFKGEAY